MRTDLLLEALEIAIWTVDGTVPRTCRGWCTTATGGRPEVPLLVPRDRAGAHPATRGAGSVAEFALVP